MYRSPSIASPTSVIDDADLENHTVTLETYNLPNDTTDDNTGLSLRQRRNRETMYQSVPDDACPVDFSRMLLIDACLQIGMKIDNALKSMARGAGGRPRPDSQALPSSSASASRLTSTSARGTLADVQAVGEPALWGALAIVFERFSTRAIEVLRECRGDLDELSGNLEVLVRRAMVAFPGFSWPTESALAFLTGTVRDCLDEADVMARRFRLLRDSDETIGNVGTSSQASNRARRITEPPPYEVYRDLESPPSPAPHSPVFSASRVLEEPQIPVAAAAPQPEVQRHRGIAGILEVVSRGIRFEPSITVGRFFRTAWRRPGGNSGTASTASHAASGTASPLIDLAEEWPDHPPNRAGPSHPTVQRRPLGARSDPKIVRIRRDVAEVLVSEDAWSEAIGSRMSDPCSHFRIEGVNPIPVQGTCITTHEPPRDTDPCGTKIGFGLQVGDIAIIYDQDVYTSREGPAEMAAMVADRIGSSFLP